MANEPTAWNYQERSHVLAAAEILTSYFQDDMDTQTATINRMIRREHGAEAILWGFNNVCALLAQQITALNKLDPMQVMNELHEQISKVTFLE